MSNKQWKDYIAGAELAWFKVFVAGEPTKMTTADGAPLYKMPIAFSSRNKIYAYFRRWWGPRLASNMVCNLPLTERNSQLYMIGYDFPPISLTAKDVEILSERRGSRRLHAVLSGGFEEEHVTYLVRDSPLHLKSMIINRSASADDFRYQTCARTEE